MAKFRSNECVVIDVARKLKLKAEYVQIAGNGWTGRKLRYCLLRSGTNFRGLRLNKIRRLPGMSGVITIMNTVIPAKASM
jgi:hypothetical protein